MRLKLYTYVASEDGLFSVTTLIVGSTAAAVIDPPLLQYDGHALIAFIKSKTSNPVTAVFISQHQPEHYFSANLVLEAFPTAKLFAAPYVVADIEDAYKEQAAAWSKRLSTSNVTSRPSVPLSYEYSFLVLPGDLTSPIVLLGPLQGSLPNHTLFWLPTERTIVAGDVVFAKSTHVWLKDVKNSMVLSAWRLTLDLIYSLDPLTIVTGHIEKGTQFDAQKDMEHMFRYLDLFEDKILRPSVEGRFGLDSQGIVDVFSDAFPNCQGNLESFLRETAESFGDEYQDDQKNGKAQLGQAIEGFVMTANIKS